MRFPSTNSCGTEIESAPSRSLISFWTSRLMKTSLSTNLTKCVLRICLTCRHRWYVSLTMPMVVVYNTTLPASFSCHVWNANGWVIIKKKLLRNYWFQINLTGHERSENRRGLRLQNMSSAKTSIRVIDKTHRVIVLNRRAVRLGYSKENIERCFRIDRHLNLSADKPYPTQMCLNRFIVNMIKNVPCISAK